MKQFKPKNHEGFTLVELIIVIAILGILSAVLMPQYIRYVEKARANVCLSQRNTAIRAFDTTCTADAAFLSTASGAGSDALADLAASDDCLGTALTCPDGGTLTYTFSASGLLDITCSEHSETTLAAEIAMKNYVGEFLDAYYQLLAQGKTPGAALNALRDDPRYSSYSKGYLQNEEIRKLYYEANGGSWVPVTIDGTVYYSKIMANVSASGFAGASDVVVYANTNAALSNDWNANFVYCDGYWYKAPVGATMASKTMSQLRAEIAAEGSRWVRADN